MIEDNFIINQGDSILITGANGFIGSRVVETLVRYGFKNMRCFVRPSSNLATLNRIIETSHDSRISVIKGNLLLREDCEKATEGVSLIYHLAAGTIGKSFKGTYVNSVITTRNLLDAIIKLGIMKRFLNVSSFSVYSNILMKPNCLLDETCAVEDHPELRGEAYCYAKVKQEEAVHEYGRKHNIPYVIVRPGAVYGPGDKTITGRVGIHKFGIFLHLGDSNRLPLTYVDNCAEAIVLAGIKIGVEGEIFNIVDDDFPSSSEFLRMYKKNVGYFRSIYIPKTISYSLCYLWEIFSKWSKGKLPPAYNRRRWSAYWKGNRYSNEKLKRLLGWKPTVSLDEGLRRYFRYCKKRGG